jgi:hypothetical protein
VLFPGEEGVLGRCVCTLEASPAAGPSVARGRRSWAGPTRQWEERVEAGWAGRRASPGGWWARPEAGGREVG